MWIENRDDAITLAQRKVSRKQYAFVLLALKQFSEEENIKGDR